MKRLLLDTNVLVRFLVQDDPKQSVAAAKLIGTAQSGDIELVLDRMVVTELVYVLMGHYKRLRVDVANTILAIVQSPFVRADDASLLIDALLRFRDHGVDFVDAWLSAKAAAANLPIASFDRDLDKFKDVTRHEPKA
jgi:predicted nucleic-acid-binding protein